MLAGFRSGDDDCLIFPALRQTEWLLRQRRTSLCRMCIRGEIRPTYARPFDVDILVKTSGDQQRWSVFSAAAMEISANVERFNRHESSPFRWTVMSF